MKELTKEQAECMCAAQAVGGMDDVCPACTTPQPAIPEKQELGLGASYEDAAYAGGWNDCRDAMLAAAPQFPSVLSGAVGCGKNTQQLPKKEQLVEGLRGLADSCRETKFRRDIKTAVTRFLSWPLPKDFAPDGGISFVESSSLHCWPVGTNLLTEPQATAMFEHCLSGTGYIAHPVQHPQQPVETALEQYEKFTKDDYRAYQKPLSAGRICRNERPSTAGTCCEGGGDACNLLA